MFEWIIGIAFLVILFFVIVMIVDGNRFMIREYTLESDKINKEYTFALLADLHNRSYGADNVKLVAAVDKVKPDVILTAGDMLTAKPGKSFETALSFMKQIAKKYPVYYGIGNHEYRMKLYREDYGDAFEKYTGALKEAGIHVLDNSTAVAEEFVVTGVSIDRKYYKRFKKTVMDRQYLPDTIGSAVPDKFHILLAHNPEYFEEYAGWGPDLVVSGHVHGGIMRLPVLGGVISPKLVLFPKYDGGLFKKDKTTMILSRGLGMHTLPIRIFNPGELVVIHLLPCKSE